MSRRDWVFPTAPPCLWGGLKLVGECELGKSRFWKYPVSALDFLVDIRNNQVPLDRESVVLRTILSD